MRVHDVLALFRNEIGNVVTYENIAVARIVGSDVYTDRILTLDEAIEKDAVSVFETSPMRVDRLGARSSVDSRVFVAGGMTLEGDTQNRAVQFPVLIAPRSATLLSVRCIERGQPTRPNTAFRRSTTIVSASARTSVVDQHKTWSTITRMQERTGAETRTDDYVAIARNKGIEVYLNALGKESIPSQLGYVAAVQHNGQVFFYCDLYGNSDIYRRLHKRLLQSVAIVALTTPAKRDISINKDKFLEFLTEASTAELEKQALADGSDGELYTSNEPVHGTALLYLSTPVQVSLRRDLN